MKQRVLEDQQLSELTEHVGGNTAGCKDKAHLQLGAERSVCAQQLGVSSTPQRLQRLGPPRKAVEDLHPSRRCLLQLALWNLAAAEVRRGQGKLGGVNKKIK